MYTDTAATRATIEAEIARVAAHLASLKRHLNTFNPDSRLPAELLVRIFHAATKGAVRWKCFFPIIHVCHHWRKVAIACRSLWSTPLFDEEGCRQPEVAQTMMEWASPLPLSIRMNDLPEDSAALSQAFDLNGMSSLRLEMLPTDFSEAMELLHGSPGTNLKHIVLCTHHLPTLALPQVLFSGHMTSLSHLHLQRCKVPWALVATSLPASIRSLAFVGCRKAIKRDLFMSILQAPSNLHTLVLDTPIHSLSEEPSTVVLSNLSHLSLGRYTFRDTTTLLRVLQFPFETATVSLQPVDEAPSPGDRITSPMSRFGLTGTSNTRIERTLQFDITANSTFALWKEDYSQLQADRYHVVPDVFLNFYEVKFSYTTAVECMASISVVGLETLVLTTGHSGFSRKIQPTDWLEFFQKHDGIQHIVLHTKQISWESFFQALATHVHTTKECQLRRMTIASDLLEYSGVEEVVTFLTAYKDATNRKLQVTMTGVKRRVVHKLYGRDSICSIELVEDFQTAIYTPQLPNVRFLELD